MYAPTRRLSNCTCSGILTVVFIQSLFNLTVVIGYIISLAPKLRLISRTVPKTLVDVVHSEVPKD
jgi:cell division protein FtsW (lipid II flippase)